MEPLDFDLRGNLGGFSTADAALGATADRPEPDDRGVISYPNYQAKKGDSVSRGQKLAKLRSGNDAYVHFEVRDGFESVDPTPYLN